MDRVTPPVFGTSNFGVQREIIGICDFYSSDHTAHQSVNQSVIFELSCPSVKLEEKND